MFRYPKSVGARTAEWRVWMDMRGRCTRATHRDWKDYGGRGIVVCGRWSGSFEAFYADMGPRPLHGYSLDRINNEGNYEPGNCRWATAKEQAANRRHRRPIKLTADAVTAIRTRYAAGGITQIALAKEFNVVQPIISHIVHRRFWKHVP